MISAYLQLHCVAPGLLGCHARGDGCERRFGYDGVIEHRQLESEYGLGFGIVGAFHQRCQLGTSRSDGRAESGRLLFDIAVSAGSRSHSLGQQH